LAKAYGIDHWFKMDMSIVRGLSYYTGIVFEGFYKHGELKKALLGGGRYDTLTSMYKPSCNYGCVGFGMGDVVILEVLMHLGKLPDNTYTIPYCIGAYNDELYEVAVNIAKQLRDTGKAVDVCGKLGFKHVLAYGDKIGAERVIMVAGEWKEGLLVVKNLRDQSPQKTMTLAELLE
jgi:histidyl-tRNA synthetase